MCSDLSVFFLRNKVTILNLKSDFFSQTFTDIEEFCGIVISAHNSKYSRGEKVKRRREEEKKKQRPKSCDASTPH